MRLRSQRRRKAAPVEGFCFLRECGDTLGAKSAQLKLSHTTNGIQVAVLNEEGTALVEKTPGQAILERIFDELN